MFCVKRERGVLSSWEIFGQNQIPIERRTHPMSGFMWKATVRNVNRALKEVNAFEWEGDYRPAAREALKRILEGEGEKGVGQYLGRAWYEGRGGTVDQLILACFVLGMSTRKVSTALLSLLGERVSAATVSEVAKALDGEGRRYHERKIRGEYRFLFFDGVGLRQKGAAKVQKRLIR